MGIQDRGCFCQRAQIGSLTSCTSSSPFRPVAPALKKAIASREIPLLVPAACGVAGVTHSESPETELGAGGGGSRGEREPGWRVPGWRCCVRPPTPDATSFRFTSAAKLE